MIAIKTTTKASNFMLSSFVQEIKVLNFLPMTPVLSSVAEVRSMNRIHIKSYANTINSTVYYII